MKKVVILLIIFLMLITGCSVKKVKELSNAEKFANEFDVDEVNPFVYANYEDIINIMNTTGIIFFATSDDECCKKSAKYLNEVAKKEKATEIYYYNIKKIKDKEPKKYKKILNYFKEYLDKNEDNEYEFSLPIVVSIKDGKIINYYNYLSKEKDLSEENLTKKKITEIKKRYKDIINYVEYTK